MNNLFIEPNKDHFADSATYDSALIEWREGMAKLSAELARENRIEDNAEARRDRDNRERSDEETMGGDND